MAADNRSTTEISSSVQAFRDLTGESLGDFRVLRLLGRGGMGEVYLAEQVSLRRNVALKVLRHDLVEDKNYRQRFEVEAKAVAPINHPNIVSVIAIGQEKGIHFIALEYVQGVNLREYLLKKGTLPLPVCQSVIRKVAAALQRASEEGIIHRDIKPENVLLTKKGEVKVADFGLARQVTNENVNLTQTGVTMGTPLYMSPEQVEGKPLDHRTDIYSLGVMCYHMLTGQPPFRGDTAMAVAIQHVKDLPQPISELRPDAPPALVKMIDKMMAKKPADRYQSAKEIVREISRMTLGNRKSEEMDATLALASASSEEPLPVAEKATKTSPITKVTSISRTLLLPKNRRWTIAVSAILALLAGAGVGWSRREPDLFKNAAAVPTMAAEPSISGIAKRKDGWFQLRYARMTLPENQKEAGLWAVIKLHPGDVDQTIEAAQDLMAIYLSQRDYGHALTLAEELIKRDNAKQLMFGYLFKGIVQSRQQQPRESNESFLKMLESGKKADLGFDQLQWLARQYFVALNANSEMLGKDRDPGMVEAFWASFAPPNGPPRRPAP